LFKDGKKKIMWTAPGSRVVRQPLNNSCVETLACGAVGHYYRKLVLIPTLLLHNAVHRHGVCIFLHRWENISFVNFVEILLLRDKTQAREISLIMC